MVGPGGGDRGGAGGATGRQVGGRWGSAGRRRLAIHKPAQRTALAFTRPRFSKDQQLTPHRWTGNRGPRWPCCCRTSCMTPRRSASR